MAVRIKHLKIFLDLAQTKSFTVAAQRNGLTQSAVSQQLHFMERQFKSRLAERTKKVPADAGGGSPAPMGAENC
jgi:DNA-binding transcriptional LysR family regulator